MKSLLSLKMGKNYAIFSLDAKCPTCPPPLACQSRRTGLVALPPAPHRLAHCECHRVRRVSIGHTCIELHTACARSPLCTRPRRQLPAVATGSPKQLMAWEGAGLAYTMTSPNQGRIADYGPTQTAILVGKSAVWGDGMQELGGGQSTMWQSGKSEVRPVAPRCPSSQASPIVIMPPGLITLDREPAHFK